MLTRKRICSTRESYDNAMSLHANQKGGEAHDTVNVLTGKRTEMGKNRTQSFYSSAILKFKDIIIF